MTFEEKIKSMTPKEIVMAMVEALTHPPIINIDMSTFGTCVITTKKYFFGAIKLKRKVCFGCAATNTICQIAGVKFTPNSIASVRTRSEFVNVELDFLKSFECAIDGLRKGMILRYNSYAEEKGFPQIKRVDFVLPALYDNYTDEDLKSYIKLAEAQ